MTLQQAMATLTLWRSRKFDSSAIAELLAVAEADVCKVLNAVREHEATTDRVVVLLSGGGAA